MCIVLLGSNSVNVSNSLKMTKSVLCVSIYLTNSVLFDMNSDKNCVVLFCINSLKVSKLFQMNTKIIQLFFLKSFIPVNLLKM